MQQSVYSRRDDISGCQREKIVDTRDLSEQRTAVREAVKGKRGVGELWQRDTNISGMLAQSSKATVHPADETTLQQRSRVAYQRVTCETGSRCSRIFSWVFLVYACASASQPEPMWDEAVGR